MAVVKPIFEGWLVRFFVSTLIQITYDAGLIQFCVWMVLPQNDIKLVITLSTLLLHSLTCMVITLHR